MSHENYQELELFQQKYDDQYAYKIKEFDQVLKVRFPYKLFVLLGISTCALTCLIANYEPFCLPCGVGSAICCLEIGREIYLDKQKSISSICVINSKNGQIPLQEYLIEKFTVEQMQQFLQENRVQKNRSEFNNVLKTIVKRAPSAKIMK